VTAENPVAGDAFGGTSLLPSMTPANVEAVIGNETNNPRRTTRKINVDLRIVPVAYRKHDDPETVLLRFAIE
jgi:hypothetical protein